MVEEVVPFAEMFAALRVVAFQDVDCAFGPWILKGENAEFLGGGDVLFDLH